MNFENRNVGVIRCVGVCVDDVVLEIEDAVDVVKGVRRKVCVVGVKFYFVR